MKAFKLYIITLGFLFLSQNGFCQSCYGFYRTPGCFVKESKYFKQYGQAKSAAIEIAKLYSYQVILYGQKDYIFSLCTESGYKPLHFKLVDDNTKEVIYDNAQDDYNQCIGFSMEKTSTVNVEIEIESESVKDKDVDPVSGRVCLGVQIWWRHIPKMGFN